MLWSTDIRLCGTCGSPVAITADDALILCLVRPTSLTSRVILSSINSNTGQTVFGFKMDSNFIGALSLSSDQQTIVTWGAPEMVVWNVGSLFAMDGRAKLSMRGKLCGHGDVIICSEFLDDSRLVTGSWDKTARIWNLTTCEELQRIQLQAIPTNWGFAVCPDLNRIACYLNNFGVFIFDDSGAEVTTLQHQPRDSLGSMAYSHSRPCPCVILL